jgi:hypothetical protein
MEVRVPYQSAASKVSRNLAAPLAAWLCTVGFTASEADQDTTLATHWLSSRGQRFQFSYEWVAIPSPDATSRLQICQAS